MTKRIVDGEGVWRSEKLAQLPEWVKPEFANLIPLAFANGVFECSPRLVWSQAYAFNRPEIGVEKVAEILKHLELVKLLFRWTDETGRAWGYWVGIEKPGRLPSTSRKNGKHERVGPTPPPDRLAAFLSSAESSTAECGQPVASQRLTSGCIGFGLGFGLGLGSGEQTRTSDKAARLDEEVSQFSFLLKDGTPFWISKPRLAELKSSYRRLDVEQELRKVGEWCKGNVSRRKTRRGAESFLVGWLNRAESDKAAGTISTNVDPEITPSQRLELRKAAATGGVQ